MSFIFFLNTNIVKLNFTIPKDINTKQLKNMIQDRSGIKFNNKCHGHIITTSKGMMKLIKIGIAKHLKKLNL